MAPRLAPVLVALLLAGCLTGGSGEPARAPDFTLTTLDGETLTLASFEGRVLVVDAMATYCGPCRASMPHFKEYLAANEGRPVALLSLDVDPTEQEGDLLRDFRDAHNATWPFAYDTVGLRRELNVRGLPTLVVIDAEGVVRDRIEYRTSFGTAELAERLEPYVAEAEARG